MSLILISRPAYGDCKYDPGNAWVECDDVSGYLVSSSKLTKLLDAYDLIEPLKEEREALQVLLGDYAADRDAYKDQRDGFEADLVIVESDLLTCHRGSAQCTADLSNAWASWEVVLLVVGVGVAALGVGIGAGMIFQTTQ